MPYSEQDMYEIERDPVRLKAYYWHMIQHWRRMARRKRAGSRAVGVTHPVTNYLPAFEEGKDDIRWANTLETCADAIEKDIDAWVKSTLVRVDQQNGSQK